MQISSNTAHVMQIFLDSIDTKLIHKWQEIGLIDGVTTNPSLAAKSNIPYLEILNNICAIVDDNVSGEVIATDFENMMQEAEKLSQISPKIIIKLPLTIDGLKACKKLNANNIRTNVTLCFSAQQAILAAKAGATYLSPFIGRIDDLGYTGTDLIQEIKEIFTVNNFSTKILAASVRNTTHVKEVAKIGAHAITLPPQILEQMSKHILTDQGLKKFLEDWHNAQQKL